MFNRIRNFFSRLFDVTAKGFCLTVFDPNGVYIRQMKNGKFRLLVNGNELVGTYTTHRGARVAAARRGLKPVDA